MEVEGSGMSGISRATCGRGGGAFHAAGDAFAASGQHRQFVDMQAGALQAFVQRAGGFAGGGFQRAQATRRRR